MAPIERTEPAVGATFAKHRLQVRNNSATTRSLPAGLRGLIGPSTTRADREKRIGAPVKHQYSYLLIRYVHDILSGEQLNVGVVVYSRSANYLGAICRPTYARLAKAFPDLRGEAFKSTTRYLQAAVKRLSETQLQSEGSQASLGDTVVDLASRVLPRDDSSFQWSAPGFGVTTDLPKTLEHLYERLVTRYDSQDQQERRPEEDTIRTELRECSAGKALPAANDSD